MSSLVMAELHVLDRTGKTTETIPVQFNPTTLQLQMTNSVEGGQSRGRQTQQYNGRASSQLSVTLEYDTADEGSSERPVDVRTKTDQVRQFVLPGGEQSKQAPPRVKFAWGTFEVVGVMTSLSEELSLFSRNGAALRSKLTVQIAAQDPKFEALESDVGANDDNRPPKAGGGDTSRTGPGSIGGGPINRAVAALSGETAADFLARNGLAPTAWRALGGALGAGVELQAGASIGFNTSISASAGIAVSGGVHVGLGATTSADLGLRSTGPTPDAALQQGFALAAAGGVTAATERAKSSAASSATDAARTKFGLRPAASSRADITTDRTPLDVASPRRSVPTTASAPSPLPQRADERATTFGAGVPLRDRVEVPGAQPDGYVVIGRTAPIDTSRGTTSERRRAPWERLGVSASSGAHRTTTGGDCGCHRCRRSSAGAGGHR